MVSGSENRQIILHPHINNTFQCNDLKLIRIPVMPPADRIIQSKQLFLIPEQHPEHRIFIMGSLDHFHKQSCLFPGFPQNPMPLIFSGNKKHRFQLKTDRNDLPQNGSFTIRISKEYMLLKAVQQSLRCLTSKYNKNYTNLIT